MKYITVFLAAVLLAGCQVHIDQPTVASNPATPASDSTATKAATSGSAKLPKTTGSLAESPASEKSVTESSTGSSSDSKVAQSSSPTPPVPTEAELKKSPGYNQDRVYQLSQLKTSTLGINGQKITAWIADDEPKRNEGLMFIKDNEIKPDQGMLFVFAAPAEQKFWMKHTYIPLDIVYIDANKKVVSTATMKSFDENNTPSHGAAKYALELKVGSVQRLGIQKGTAVDIPSGIVAQDPPSAGPPQMGG